MRRCIVGLTTALSITIAVLAPQAAQAQEQIDGALPTKPYIEQVQAQAEPESSARELPTPLRAPVGVSYGVNVCDTYVTSSTLSEDGWTFDPATYS